MNETAPSDFQPKVPLNKARMMKSRKMALALFDQGQTFFKPPLLIRYQGQSDPKHFHCLVTVSKRKFKKAVHRNRIKRILKEAIRQSPSQLPWPEQVALIYIGKNLPKFNQVLRAWQAFLKKIEEEQPGKFPP